MILGCINRKENMVEHFKNKIHDMKDKDIKNMLGSAIIDNVKEGYNAKDL